MINPRMGHLLVEEIKDDKEKTPGILMIDTSKPLKGKVIAMPLEGNPKISTHLGPELVGKIVYFNRATFMSPYVLVNEEDVLASE